MYHVYLGSSDIPIEVDADSYAVTIPDGYLNLYKNNGTIVVATFSPETWAYVMQVVEK